MSGTKGRPKATDRPQGGVTLVELLVTIVISTLFFAALVPVFVFAQKQSSGDRARVIAANVAQAKLETVRSVDYALIDEDGAYFEDPTGVAAGFGTTWPNDQGGPVKTYRIDYDVDFVYSTENPTEVVYKLVTVDVYWTPPPAPVKHVVLKTAVYPQYKGPEIGDMTIEPLVTIGEGTEDEEKYIPSQPVTIKARVETMDLESTDYIRFAVSATNGSYVEVRDVPVEQAIDGWFAWVWQDANAGDGEYLFTAVGVSNDGRLGETWKLQYVMETGPPGAPRSVTGECGNNVVVLSWLPPEPVAGDLASYTIRRSDGEAFPALSKRSTTFIDRSVTNGTPYGYDIYAVDVRGNESIAASSGALTPATPADIQTPTMPTGLTATVIGQSVKLQWTPNPVSQVVAKYRVYRSDDTLHRSPIAIIATNAAYTSYSYTDPEIGWNSPGYTYYVTAVDAALNESPEAQTAQVQTPEAPPEETYSLTIKVKGDDALVMVASLVDGSVYDTDGNRVVGDKHVAQEFVQSSNKKGVTFSNLPYSTYRITVTFVNKQRVPIADPIWRDVELARRDEPSIEFTH